MSTLHIISSLEQLSVALPFISNDDHLLLIQQAAYLALAEHPKKSLLEKVNSYSFLDTDLLSRGLIQRHDSQAISMAGFVELTARHSKSIHWG
ncbi:DsrH/TusB family sulfur relay protein [Vibrio ulleungensis]|uniref:Sulfurtransferase complex subunit TusB n=1 Tax=Vibrio ulleungensis TaxID=2807619 RepID=A0ABS2HL39_9VIBR|nr:DsrH/TusB family sulfur metabolism protein [Vibrio ulleungensis]MBM7037282.1 sulfurtransferase complex subunit TusB [Vibrio ulleungensis]